MPKNRHPVRAEMREATLVAGSIAPNAGSALVAGTTRGVGFTAAFISLGVFRLTLLEAYTEITAKKISLQLNALADTDVMFGPFVAAVGTTPATLDILVKTAGVAANIAANANNRIDFELTCRRTGISP